MSGLRNLALIAVMVIQLRPGSAPPSRSTSGTATRTGSGGGSGSVKRAVSSTMCWPTTRPRRTWTPTSLRRKWGGEEESPLPVDHPPRPDCLRPLRPHVSGGRDHRIPRKRRDDRERPADRRPGVPADHQTLRPKERRDHPRRDRADTDLTRMLTNQRMDSPAGPRGVGRFGTSPLTRLLTRRIAVIAPVPTGLK